MGAAVPRGRAGVSVTGIDFREVASKVKDGNIGALQEMVTNASEAASGAQTTDTPELGIPEANKALVAPFKDKVSTWMVYGAFGL